MPKRNRCSPAVPQYRRLSAQWSVSPCVYARLARRAVPAVFLTVGLAGSAGLAAEDGATVYAQPASGNADPQLLADLARGIRGSISVWEERLAVRTGGDEVVLTDDAVLGVEIAWGSPAAAAANEAYIDGRYVDAIPLAQQVIDADGVPQWQQELLGLQIVSAALQLGDAQTAIDVYLTLAQYKLPRFAAAYLPVSWTAGQTLRIDPKAIRVTADSELKRMIVASYALGTADHATASQRLETLARSGASDAALLSKFQWYRFQPPSVLADELPVALRLRDRLSPASRVGPTVTIADLLQRSGQDGKAVAFWLEAGLLANDGRLPIAGETYGAIEDALRTSRPAEWDKIEPLLRPR